MKSAVLFIIFKREEITRKTFARIREAQPPRLYIAADGPRSSHPEDVEKCMATRKVVENVDWPCEVHRLYHDENLGCGHGPASAITWFFENEEKGVIIEDDILPHIDFFKFCDEMLDRFEDEERIHSVCGRNTTCKNLPTEKSYYLSSYSAIWGWATWRRVWQTYKFDLKEYSPVKVREKINQRLPLRSALYFNKIYDKMTTSNIDAWDYQFFINMLICDRYSIMPYTNMIQNIGFGDPDATHTKNFSEKNLTVQAYSPYPLLNQGILTTDEWSDFQILKSSGQYVYPFLVRAYKKLHRDLISFCERF